MLHRGQDGLRQRGRLGRVLVRDRRERTPPSVPRRGLRRMPRLDREERRPVPEGDAHVGQEYSGKASAEREEVEVKGIKGRT